MPTLATCENKDGLRPSAELPLPKDLALAAPNGGPADPFLGKWWGIYGNGREFMLAIESVSGDAVRAVYAYGELGTSPAGMRRSTGRVTGGVLVFDDSGGARLEYRRNPDGTLVGKWSKGDTVLVGTMRHPPS
jgi:hypothetical protein